MISLLSRALPLAALLFAVSSASQSDTSENQAPLVPVEAFASLPTFDDAKLPPNGEKVAYAITHKGRKHVITQNLDGSDRQLIPPIDDADISSFFWANNETLLVKYGMTLNRMEFRATTKETRYIAYHTNGEKPRWLGKPKQDLGRQKSGNIEYMSQVEHIVDRLPNDPNHILMELDFELDTQPSVFKVNVNNGRRSQVRGGKRGVQNWYTDNESEVRLGSGYVTRGTKKVMMYKGTDGKWIDLKKLDWTDWYSIYDFANEPDTLYVGGNSEYGTTGIFTVNVLTGQISSHVFTHENVDIDDLASHPVTGKLAGVSYADNFYRTHYFDKELALLQRSFDKVLPGAINRIASISTEKQLYLIYSASDTNPGDYYLYDRPNRQLNFIANRMAHINPSHMAHTKEVRITMRDGSTIPAFLTLPKGKENTKNLPFLIMPHGGPESRDTAHWDYKAQFLANRGYGVLKPNFRGSTGYGNAFEAAGSNQWGGLM